MLETLERLWAAAQKVRQIADQLKQADMKLAVADLLNTVADLKAERAQQQEDNTELRRQLRELQERLAVRRKVVFREGLYYLAEPEPGVSAGPFCPVCFEKEAILITVRLLRTLNVGTNTTRLGPGHYCPACTRRFHDDTP